MNETKKTQISWRREYIRVLSEGPAEGSKEDSEEELDLMRELIEGDYATGYIGKNNVGNVAAVAWEGPTVKGRIFIDELKEYERKRSWKHKMKTGALAIGSWAVGILTAILIKKLTEA